MKHLILPQKHTAAMYSPNIIFSFSHNTYPCTQSGIQLKSSSSDDTNEKKQKTNSVTFTIITNSSCGFVPTCLCFSESFFLRYVFPHFRSMQKCVSSQWKGKRHNMAQSNSRKNFPFVDYLIIVFSLFVST